MDEFVTPPHSPKPYLGMSQPSLLPWSLHDGPKTLRPVSLGRRKSPLAWPESSGPSGPSSGPPGLAHEEWRSNTLPRSQSDREGNPNPYMFKENYSYSLDRPSSHRGEENWAADPLHPLSLGRHRGHSTPSELEFDSLWGADLGAKSSPMLNSRLSGWDSVDKPFEDYPFGFSGRATPPDAAWRDNTPVSSQWPSPNLGNRSLERTWAKANPIYEHEPIHFEHTRRPSDVALEPPTRNVSLYRSRRTLSGSYSSTGVPTDLTYRSLPRSNGKDVRSMEYDNKRHSRQDSFGRAKDPLGIFFWGFPEYIGVKEIISEFSSFGYIVNVAIERGTGANVPARYGFVDFEHSNSVRAAHERLEASPVFSLSKCLSVRYRYDKSSVPEMMPLSFESGDLELDYRSIPQLDTIFSRMGEVRRIKTFQHDRKTAVLISFRSADQAKRAVLHVRNPHTPIFRDMTESLDVEYPAKNPHLFGKDVPHSQPWNRAADPFNPLDSRARLSLKRAKKTAATENRIVYIRELKSEWTTREALEATFKHIGAVESFVLIQKASNPDQLSAFVVFPHPLMASAAIGAKVGGCTLPRHKRVDFPGVPLDIKEKDLISFFAEAGEIKQMTLPREYATIYEAATGSPQPNEPGSGTAMIEFVTSMGAAKGIVLGRQVVAPFCTQLLQSDYSPSLKSAEEMAAEQETANNSPNSSRPSSGSYEHPSKDAKMDSILLKLENVNLDS